jgi:hypothetical protein
MNVVKGYIWGNKVAFIGVALLAIWLTMMLFCTFADIRPSTNWMLYIMLLLPIGALTAAIGIAIKLIFERYCDQSGIGSPANIHIVAAKEKYRKEKWWWASGTMPDGWKHRYSDETRII